MKRQVALIISLQLMASVIIYAFCPTPQQIFAWGIGLGLGYTWPFPVFPPPAFTDLSVDASGIADDVHAAFRRWTYANQSQNSTNDTFSFGGGGVRVYIYQVNFPGVPFQGDRNKAAESVIAVYEDTNVVANQDILLYFGSICSPNQAAFPCWDLNADNFHTFVQKTMAHEIGHAMGINDQFLDPCLGQFPGESVMNGQCGTNDAQGTMPDPSQLGIPDCDNMSVW